MTLKRTGNAAVIVKLNMAALWTKWRDDNCLSDNWQGKRHLSIMENCMSNNVAAILNSNTAAIWWQFPHSKHFPRYKESLFSFQSLTGSEIQSNVKHMAAILKSNMAAPWRKFLHCQNVPRHRKHIDTWMLILGAIEQEIWAKLWSFWRHIGNQYGGHQVSRIVWVCFFNDLYVLQNTCEKYHAFFKNWTILVLSRPTKAAFHGGKSTTVEPIYEGCRAYITVCKQKAGFT